MSECAPKIQPKEVEVGIDISKSIFDSYKTAKYHKFTDYLVGEVFRKEASSLGWSPFDLISENDENIKRISNGIRAALKNGLIDTENNNTHLPLGEISFEAYKDIKDIILPNFTQFIKHYWKFNAIIKNAELAIEDGTLDGEFPINDNSQTDEDMSSPEELKDMRGPKFERPGNDESPIDLASTALKTVFRLIPKAFWNKDTNKVELVKDSDGLPTTADFGPVFNKLLVILGGTKEIEEMISKLSSKDTLRIVPEAQYIAEVLKAAKAHSSRSVDEYNILNDFYLQFSMPKIQVQSASMSEKQDFNVFDEISGNLMGIREQFSSNFQMGNVADSVKRYLKIDELHGVYLGKPKDVDIKDHLPSVPTTEKERLDFLSLLGIQFSGLSFLDTEMKKQDFEAMLTRTSNFLYESVVKRLNAGEQLFEPLSQLKEQFKSSDKKIKVRSERKSIGEIEKFESKYSTVSPSLSTRTANGELAYLVSLDNQLSIVTYHLNNAKTLKDLMDTPPFRTAKHEPLFKNSYIVNYLFDDKGERRVDPDGKKRTVDLTNLSGFKEFVGKKGFSKLERELSPKKKFIQDMNMMWLNGKTDTMRTETSNSFFTISLIKYNGEVQKYFQTDGFLTSFISNNGFKKVIYGYLKSEIERIKSYTDKKRENPELPDTYNKFSIFYETLEQDNSALGGELKKAGDFKMDSPIFDKFMESFENQLKRDVQDLKNEMDKLDISKDELVSRNARQQINGDLTENQKLSDKEFDALLRSFVANALVQNIEFSIMYGIDPLYTNTFHKRLKGLSSTGTLAATHSLFTEFRQSSYENMFHDRYSISGALGKKYRNNDKTFQTKTLVEYKQAPGKQYAYTNDKIIDDIQDSLLKRDGVNTTFTREYIIKHLLAKRESQSPADGQGYISLDFHRELALRHGFHNKYLEKAYRYEGLIYRRDIAKKQLSQDEAQELFLLEQLIYSNPNAYVIPVLKMTYWGGIESTTINAKALDKLSTAPLLPSDVRNNPKLEKLLTDMTNKQIGYVKYESGTKLYTTTPVDIENISTVDRPDLYATELLKMQIKPKSQQGDSTSIPTQFLKLIFTNLFSEGRPTNEKVAELYKKYIENLKGIQKIQASKFMDELGISAKGVDLTQLSERLIAQAKSQNLNSNTIKALEVQDGSLAGVLEESGFIKQIIDLVSGLADSRLRRWQLPGGDFVLVSNANRGKLNFYKYNGNESTTAADIRITLNGEFIKLFQRNHPDGKPIATLKRLNALLDNAKWRDDNKKSLTVIMGRVPIQGPNSMEFGIVREFLSPTMGNVVILPDEVTFKGGLDFDYDKQKVMTPSFTSDGRYIENLTDVEKKIKAVQDKYNGLIMEYYNAKNPTESMDKVREYIADLKNIIKSGSFNKLSPKAQTQKQIAELKDTFVKVVNLEIAKQQFEDIISIIDKYKNFEVSVEKFDFVPDARFESHINNQMEILRDEINTITDIFYKKLKDFTKGEVETVILDGYRLRDEILSLERLQGKELQENYNRIVEGYAETLALPEMFAELVTPNSTKIVSPLADRNALLKGLSIAVPTRNKVLNYLANFHVKNILFSAKNMLSPFAIDNTYMEVMQYLGININGQYQRKWGKDKDGSPKFVTRTINHHLLNSYEINRITTGNVIRTSLKDDIENYIKQHIDSESINFTVDSAKDPRFALLNITWENVGVVNLMKMMGYPFSRILDFINQPILIKYGEFIKNGLSKNEAIAKIGESLGIVIKINKEEIIPGAAYRELKSQNVKFEKEEKLKGERYKVTYTEISGASHWDVRNILRKIDNKEDITDSKFKDVKDKLKYEAITLQLVERINKPPVSDDFNLRVFAHFITMDEHNSVFRNFQYYFNDDRVKVSTPTDVQSKDNTRALLVEQGMFSVEDIQKMEDFSPIGAFMNNEILKQAYEKILPIVGRKDVQDTMDEVYKEYLMSFGRTNKRDVRNMPKVLVNDFITAILFNFSKVEGKSFIKRNMHLLIKEKGKRTISERLDALRKQPFYPKLAKQFPVLDALNISNFRIEDTNDLNGIPKWSIIRNIKLTKPAAETSIEEESVIDQFKILQAYTIKDKKYSKEDRKTYTTALHRFMKDLFDVGILQSGVAKTQIGFAEYIPHDYIRALFSPAIKQLDSLDSADFSNFLVSWKNQFRYNNPKYFSSIKENGKRTLNNNKYSARFKLYDEDLNYNTDAIDDEEDPSQEGPGTVTEGSTRNGELIKQNVFAVNPIQPTDKKAVIKASVANKFIGFGEGIKNSSTEIYRKQAGKYANIGNYSPNDVVFISIGGKRGTPELRKEQQDKTIREAIKAIEAGATLITDNKAYVESSDYNEGEKRLAKNLESKGYLYSEQTIDGQVLGVWNKQNVPQAKPREESEIYSKLGNKTKSVNVKIKPWKDLKYAKKAITPEGIIATRMDTQSFIPGSGDEHFGNPFTHDEEIIKRGAKLILVESKTIREAVEKYINWVLTGKTGEYVFDSSMPDPSDLEMQREWILEQLKSGELKNKPILYYKELGQPSHATALDYLINKYDWSKTTPAVKEAKFVDITDITRDKKKETFKITIANDTKEEVEGYRVHIKEYPAFKGFVHNRYGKWTVTEETTGRNLGAYGKSAKEAMKEAIVTLNNAQKGNATILEQIGITRIQPDNLPPIDIEQKCKK